MPGPNGGRETFLTLSQLPVSAVAPVPSGASRRHQSGPWQAARAVCWKDWRSEWRTRAALNAIGLFSLAAPVTVGFGLARQKVEPETLGALLWTVLFFAALVGLPRAFVKEEETGTAALLRLHFPAQAVLWGKCLAQLSLLLGTQLAAIPVFALLLGAEIKEPGTFAAVLFLGDLGLAVVSCILGAMAAQARSRGTLFCAIAAPLMLPFLLCTATATGAAFGAAVDATPALTTLVAFDVVMLSAAWMLWDFVWN